MRRLVLILLCAAAFFGANASAACWQQAADRIKVSPQLLVAIGKVESNLNPLAVNRSHIKRTGSYGIGLMQVESSNLADLAKQGITESHLYDPCTNVMAGASILGEKIARFGLTWEAIGAYNASCTVLKGADCRRARSVYAWKVYRALAKASPQLPSVRAMGVPARPRGVS